MDDGTVTTTVDPAAFAPLFIGYPILAFGDARYVGAGDTTAPQQAPAHV